MIKKTDYILLKSFCFVFAFLLFSCGNSKKEIAEKENINSSDAVDSQSYFLSRCKPIELKGKTIEAGTPKIIKAGSPEITSGFNNVHPLGKLKTIADIKGQNISDSIKPTTAKANGKQVVCSDPKITVALIPAMREQNPIGFKFFDIAQ